MKNEKGEILNAEEVGFEPTRAENSTAFRKRPSKPLWYSSYFLSSVILIMASKTIKAKVKTPKVGISLLTTALELPKPGASQMLNKRKRVKMTPKVKAISALIFFNPESIIIFK